MVRSGAELQQMSYKDLEILLRIAAYINSVHAAF
jgi:hypothetical protein